MVDEKVLERYAVAQTLMQVNPEGEAIEITDKEYISSKFLGKGVYREMHYDKDVLADKVAYWMDFLRARNP